MTAKTVPAPTESLEMDFDFHKELIGDEIEGIERINPNDFVKGPPGTEKKSWVNPDMDAMWEENYSKNKKYLQPCPTQDFHKKLYILVGSSPAVKRNIHFLHDIDDRFEVIACNTTAKLLLEHGVNFKYVMSIEGGAHISPDFDFDSKDKVLIASPFVCPDAYEKWDGEKYTYFLSGGEKYKKAFERDWAGKVDIDIGGGNVLSAAYLWAYKYMNARHFAVIGMSLCYYDDNDYYFDGREKPNDPLGEWSKWLKALDMYGNIVTTTPPLLMYKQWLETYTKYAIQYGGGSFINSTEDGILGVLPKPIEADGLKVRFQPTYVPWMNIAPLYQTIGAHKKRMEDEQYDSGK